MSTLFDLYGLPRNFPEREQLVAIRDTEHRADQVQARTAHELGDDPRLIPYVQRHEFEALVLAALDDLAALIDDREEIEGLGRLRAEIGRQGPEEVDDGPTSAPSKRLRRAIPGFQKTAHGLLAVESCGLRCLRAACPRFHRWIADLEKLA